MLPSKRAIFSPYRWRRDGGAMSVFLMHSAECWMKNRQPSKSLSRKTTKNLTSFGSRVFQHSIFNFSFCIQPSAFCIQYFELKCLGACEKTISFLLAFWRRRNRRHCWIFCGKDFDTCASPLKSAAVIVVPTFTTNLIFNFPFCIMHSALCIEMLGSVWKHSFLLFNGASRANKSRYPSNSPAHNKKSRP